MPSVARRAQSALEAEQEDIERKGNQVTRITKQQTIDNLNDQLKAQMKAERGIVEQRDEARAKVQTLFAQIEGLEAQVKLLREDRDAFRGTAQLCADIQKRMDETYHRHANMKAERDKVKAENDALRHRMRRIEAAASMAIVQRGHAVDELEGNQEVDLTRLHENEAGTDSVLCSFYCILHMARNTRLPNI